MPTTRPIPRPALRGFIFAAGAGLLLSLTPGRGATPAAFPEPGDLRSAGSVNFPVTCAPEVQAEFSRGVALLHSFFYEESRRVFTEVARRDPACAMAQWGIAMTWWHPRKPAPLALG